MPRGDKTGPNGQGPMTGRQMGNCNPNAGTGRRTFGFGRRCGGGRGYRNGYGYAPISEASEKKALEAEVSMLKDQLAAMESKLSELTK